ncbi:hypothetical protein AVEN_147092-1 [Araneus ventricosus]|uniref:Uncharacterized protein n=1 Tax=Araneus ventricosus TaxID=182803 RepID=A0A4Y2E559_ARAVE|nr:hypothetical protein AVEN_147092-1 [Araneus ventricosus]
MAIQNSKLHPSFINEVVKIVEDETIVRSNLKSVSDVYSWIEEYGRTSDTKWNLRSSRPSGTRLMCWFHFEHYIVAIQVLRNQTVKTLKLMK